MTTMVAALPPGVASSSSSSSSSASPSLRQSDPQDAHTLPALAVAIDEPVPSAPSANAIISWSDEKIKSVSQLRARKDLRRNVSTDIFQEQQKRLGAHPDIPYALDEVQRQAKLYVAWIEEHEGSHAHVSISNEHCSSPADACPPWDFVWVEDYVHDERVPSDEPDELQGCDCEDESCDPETCACFARACRYEPSDVYKNIRDFAYQADGALNEEVRKWDTYPVFECNSKCGCSKECRNRVVQKGRKVDIQFFKHAQYGWGIRAGQLIKAYSFVGAYTGELVGDVEGDRRADLYEEIGSTYHFTLDNHLQKRDTVRRMVREHLAQAGASVRDAVVEAKTKEYIQLFDMFLEHTERESLRTTLDEIDARRRQTDPEWTEAKAAARRAQRARWEAAYANKEFSFPKLSAADQQLARRIDEAVEARRARHELTVDGALFGNFTRFFNHSCDPTLAIWPVWTETGSLWKPLHCFFATRDIQPGEELTFNYNTSEVEMDEFQREASHFEIQEGRKKGTRAMRCLCGASNCRGFVFG